MSEYVLAHRGDEVEQRRMALLDEYHGPLTVAQLAATGVGPGWCCLEVGAGSGAMTSRLAERVAPSGRVLAVDRETHCLDPLTSEIVEVRQGDITTMQLPLASFDLVVAQMLLLHLPDPADTARQLLTAAKPTGQLIIHDADFTPLALDRATELEAAGIAVMTEMMRAAGVHLALGPGLASLLRDAGAIVEHVEAQLSAEHDSPIAARITALTLERFTHRVPDAGPQRQAIKAAVAALRDPARAFNGPTRWIVRCRPTN
jgi:SAM-dependent methyltransferase